MNARQRRYLVTSLKSISVVFGAAYLTALTIGWLFATESTGMSPLFSPTSAALLLLACGGVLWLAHFVTLGAEARVRNLDPPGSTGKTAVDGECPSWPTILAWLVTDLEGDDARRISSHVSSCEDCRKRLALMNAVQEMSSDRGR
jgi:hypothetical protein